MKHPFLTGEHVYLRTIQASDLNANYREWFNDEEVTRYNSHHRFPNYDENMREYYENVIRSKQNLVLAICERATDAHIGNIALENINTLDRSAEFAILIGDKNYQAKGVGKEAGALLIAHGFEALNLHRIYLGTQDDNIGMQKLAQSLGFTEEGRQRQAIFKAGKFKDIIFYGLLRSEWKT